MSLSVNNLYEFGDFRLDIKEKILMRSDRQIELTPKGFELLSLFVENHGRLLEKEELMDRIWADSFVEESNLTFNIRQLRKILGDDAHKPKYIKTVRRHGYRFIAEVRQISKEEKPANEKPNEISAPVVSQPDKIVSAEPIAASPETANYPKPILFAAAAMLLIAAFGFGSWYFLGGKTRTGVPVLSAPFSSEKLSTSGKVSIAALSPDGKNVVYVNRIGVEKQSVWLRQLDNGSNIEIIPPSEESYLGLVFSPDGNLLYFARRPRQTNAPMGIYRVSIHGGIPQKLVSETEGWISVSPDGAKISFVRCYYRDDEYCSLWIADAVNAGNERKIISRPSPFRIADNRFSPDGKSIAFAVGQSATGSNEFGLSEVNIESGIEREITGEKFFNIKNLVWLPDKSGLLMTARKNTVRNFRIWQVSLKTGEVVPLTNDSETYSVLSLDKTGTSLISTQVKADFRLRLVNAENTSQSRILTNAIATSFAPDGKIYFSSIMSGNSEIWSINPDGSGQRQLTNNPTDDSVPVVSPDNSSVYFTSNRTGEAQVWRMNADGSNQTQVTKKNGGAPFFVSPDGEWIYYRHNLTSMLWRVSTKSGEEQTVLNKPKAYFAVSPDSSQVAYSERQNNERLLTVASLSDGQILKTFHLPEKNLRLLNIIWLPDGKNLIYISADSEYQNNRLWLQPLNEEKPSQIAVLGNEEIGDFSLAISPDTKTFAIVQGEWLHDAVLLKGLR